MDRVPKRGRLIYMLERLFEGAIWKSRFIVLLAVVFGLIGAFVLFIVASIDIWQVAVYTFETILTHAHPEKFHEDVVAGIIGAVDLYLIAVVMFIFSFGVYELFISKIDDADESKGNTILAIHSLDQLKDKRIYNSFRDVIFRTIDCSFSCRIIFFRKSR